MVVGIVLGLVGLLLRGNLSTLAAILTCFSYLMKNISDSPTRTHAAALVSMVRLSVVGHFSRQSRIVILSPSSVILNEVKNLRVNSAKSLRTGSAKDLGPDRVYSEILRRSLP